MSESRLFVLNCEKEIPRIGIENEFPFFYEPGVLDDLFLKGGSLGNFTNYPQGSRSPSQRCPNVVQNFHKDFAAERVKKINDGYVIRDHKLDRVCRNKFDVAALQSGQCAAHISSRDLIQLRSDLDSVNFSKRVSRGHDDCASHSRTKV